MWGCDGPTAQIPTEIECPRCNGSLGKCKLCGGDGILQVLECPRKWLTPRMSKLIEALGWARKGMLPAPGALHDQAATFYDALNEFNRLLSDYEAEQIEKINKKNK